MQYLIARECQDNGIISELNRQIFHPRGLALELEIDDDKPHIPAIIRIQDHRPEGVMYDDQDAELMTRLAVKKAAFEALPVLREAQSVGGGV